MEEILFVMVLALFIILIHLDNMLRVVNQNLERYFKYTCNNRKADENNIEKR